MQLGINNVMVASEPHVIAQPLDPGDPDLPEKMQDILEKGKRSWLKNTEVCDMLLHYTKFNLRIAREPPCQPPGNAQTTPVWSFSILVQVQLSHNKTTCHDVLGSTINSQACLAARWLIVPV